MPRSKLKSVWAPHLIASGPVIAAARTLPQETRRLKKLGNPQDAGFTGIVGMSLPKLVLLRTSND